MLINNQLVKNESLVGIVDRDGILKSTIPVNSPERVKQLETIVYGKESYTILGFFQDAEKILALAESGSGKTYTFKIKLKDEISDNVRYTLTNRDLLDADFIPAAFTILGGRIGYAKRQEIKALLDEPKSSLDLIQEFLDIKFASVYEFAKSNGLILPHKANWIAEYRRNNSDDKILEAILE